MIPTVVKRHSNLLARTQRITSVLEYETAEEPGLQRTLVTENSVQLALDIQVNVQDFFRGERHALTLGYSTVQLLTGDLGCSQSS